jgi:hypothetical protein
MIHRAILILLALVFVSGAGCSSGGDDRLRADESSAIVNPLRVEEAQAVVKLNEIRLFNVEARAQQEDLKWANVKETFESAKAAHEKGAISERSFRDAKEQYDWWVLQDNIQDWQEAQAELEIAKIRLRMVQRGIEVYHGQRP